MNTKHTQIGVYVHLSKPSEVSCIPPPQSRDIWRLELECWLFWGDNGVKRKLIQMQLPTDEEEYAIISAFYQIRLPFTPNRSVHTRRRASLLRLRSCVDVEVSRGYLSSIKSILPLIYFFWTKKALPFHRCMQVPAAAAADRKLARAREVKR